MELFRVSPEIALRFRADGFSFFFLLLFFIVYLSSGVYATDYMKKEGNQRRFFDYYCLSFLSLIGLSFAGNLFSFLVFFEMMTLFMLPLVAHEDQDRSRHAAMSFLGYSMFGAALAVMGLFLLGGWGVSTEFQPGGNLAGAAASKGGLLAAYFLIAIGFSAKAGMAPLNAWLPIAHPEAPSPASAVLSAAITKCGLLGMLRATFYIFGADFLAGSWPQTLLLILAALTVFAGSMLALGEKQIKRRLAWSTVSQVSYAIFGMLLLSPAGLLGALLQVAAHGAAKCGLFLWAGAAMQATGKSEVGDFRGLGRSMPVSMWCFSLFSLSLIGIPPLLGFSAKWYLATGALGYGGGLGLWGMIALMVSALLTAAYLLPVAAAAFFPGRDFAPDASVREAPPKMLWALVALAALALLPGIFPAPLIGALNRMISGIL